MLYHVQGPRRRARNAFVLDSITHSPDSEGCKRVAPWLAPQDIIPGHVGVVFVNQAKLKLVRMNIVEVKGKLSILEFHYLLGRPEGVKHFTELDIFGLFTHTEYLSAFRRAGLTAKYDREGLIGRGLCIGVKPTGVSNT